MSTHPGPRALAAGEEPGLGPTLEPPEEPAGPPLTQGRGGRFSAVFSPGMCRLPRPLSSLHCGSVDRRHPGMPTGS